MEKVFLLILLLTYPQFSNAQFIKSVGFKIGGSLTQQDHQLPYSELLEGAYHSAPSSLVGLNIGVFIELLNLQYVNVIAEVNYIQRGWRSIDGNSQNQSYKYEYANVTLLIKHKLSGNSVSPYLLIGPELDLETNRPSGFSINYKKNMIGLIIGIGSEIKILERKILAEIIYDFYINKLFEDYYLKVTSKTLSLRVGLHI